MGLRTMIHRFMHLSDIHFGQEKGGTLVTHEHIRMALTADAREFARLHGPASRILITGDIAYSGLTEEYKTATKWLEQLTAAAGCHETHVSPIPGNHDCDLKADTHQAKMISAQLRASAPELAKATLHEINLDGEAASPFLPKLKAYREFASSYGCDFESARRPLWTRNFEFEGGIRLRLFGLTSVQVSDLKDDKGNMILGNEQFTIQEEENVINVMLVHHPLDWFLDEAEAYQYIKNNVRVLMVGHEHTLNIQKAIDQFTKKEILNIFAGATNPPTDPNNYGYAYNWIEFSCDHKNEIPGLTMKIFPRIWVQENVRFEPDHRRLGGAKDSVTVDVSCQNLFPRVPEEVVVVIEEPAQDTVASPPPEDSLSTTARQTAKGEVPMTNSSQDFDRLRYLFWQYLDWQQRLKILVDADALPKTATQPVPQTLERLALENVAGDAAKLRAMWESIMPLIPNQKRGPNPF
jgi:hypothetical protein